MKIHFYSFTDGKKSISFQEEATFDGKSYEFLDHSAPNTKLRITIVDEATIRVKRFGTVNNEILIKENDTCISTYSSPDLNFKFMVKGYDIKIKADAISFSYDYYYDGDYVGKIKIGLLIKA